jgi:hypothetical protein
MKTLALILALLCSSLLYAQEEKAADVFTKQGISISQSEREWAEEFTKAAGVTSEEEKMIFDLFPQNRPHIYSVKFKHDGVDRWYQLETSVVQKKKRNTVIADVYYDTISKNFFTIHSGVVTIIPMNRPHALKFHNKSIK